MRTWTNEHIAFLTENYGKMSIAEIAEHLGKTACATKTKALNIGLRTGRNKFWSGEENEYLRKYYPTTFMKDMCEYLGRSEKSIYMQAKLLGIKKDKDVLHKWHKDNVPKSFLENRYKKGDIPHNKGVPMGEEKYEKCKGTMFKKGQTPKNTHPDGDGAITFRRNKDWHCYNVRISKGKWIPLHRYVWQEVNGAIPKGFIVTFKNGDYHDCRIENLELMSRADNMRRNSFRNYPPEVRQMIATKGGFNRKLNKIIKEYEQKN